MTDRTDLPPDAPPGTVMQTPSQASLALDQSIDPHAPELPPGYELIRELGRGGMGVVYHVRQAQLNRTAAVKLMLCGDLCAPADVRRFAAEGEAVARVRHPNVVQVYDAGRHRGIPFVAMEYVPGGPLSARLKDGPLSPPVAARLMQQVADGVAACHAAGVLHRDLKPANILLARSEEPGARIEPAATISYHPYGPPPSSALDPDSFPVPKVADFGLAKRVDSDGPTAPGMLMGTPCYMAPEQAAGADVGPAADIYALGAVLYELLTGRPPFQGPDGLEVLRRAREDEPLPVRALQPSVPRDLETVCMKCLAKEPARRYATAAALADDLRRWQAGEPITARPASSVERAVRWGRRNRPLVFATAAVFAALLAGTVVSLHLAAEARTARWDAEQAADAERAAAVRERDARAAAEKSAAAAAADRQTAEAVAEFLGDVLEEGSPRRQRAAAPARTVADALRYAAATIGRRFPGRPDLEAAVRGSVGEAFLERGEYTDAEPQLVAAFKLSQSAHGPDHPTTLKAARRLGNLYRLTGRRNAAEPLLKRAADGHRAALGDRHPETLASLSDLAALYFDWERLPAAEPLLRESAAGHRAVQPGHPTAFRAAGNLGVLLHHSGRPDEAGPLLTEAVDGLAATLGPDHPDTSLYRLNLGQLHLSAGRLKEAEPALTAAWDGLRAACGPDHPDTLAAAVALGACRSEQGNPAAAIPALTAAADGFRAKLGPTHADTLWAAGNLASGLLRAGRPADAVPVLERLVSGLRAYGDGETTAVRQAQLGRAYLRLKRYPEAERELLEATAELTARLPKAPKLGPLAAQAAADLRALYAEWRPAPREAAPVPRRVENGR